MRTNFILFLAAFFTVYGLVNLYIFIRGWQVLFLAPSLRLYYSLGFFIVASSFIGGRLLENVWLSAVSDVLVWMGAFWIAAMLYFFLSLLLLDLLRLVNHWVPFFPSFVTAHPSTAKGVVALVITGSILLLLAAGHVNARIPRVQTLHLTIPKKVQGLETLSVVAASDIHLGSIIGKKRLDSMVARINALNPDLVLLPGDIVDEDLAPVIKHNLGDTLRNLSSRWGVFAVTGNHEYIGGVEEAYAYLSEHGVTVLRDRVVKVKDAFYLVGREDRSIRRAGKNRKPLQELMALTDPNCPIILMDHQPFQLEEGETNGVDLQISGHTHHGQLWPLNLITRRVYELSWGYKKKNSTHVYVSCGFGTWGPPVRLGNRPEIVNIRISFLKPDGLRN
jgi:predicted MPP superfamily phosphohydrolase